MSKIMSGFTTPPRPVIKLDRNPCTVGLKTVFKAINERSPYGREARRYFEGIKTSIQCKDVLGRPSNCWICGGEFSATESRFFPQCDHVLPIAQGAIFLQLYTTRTGNPTEAMILEYGWAHAICNNVKNAQVLISGTESSFTPDVAKITGLLNNLKEKGVPILDDARQIETIQRKMLEIITYINQLPNYEINIPGELCPRVIQFTRGGKTFKRRNNGVSRRTYKHSNRKASRTYRKRRASN